MKQTHTEGIMEIKIKNKNLEMYIWTREARFTERIHKWKANLKHGRYNRMDGHISEKMLNLILPDIKYPENPG